MHNKSIIFGINQIIKNSKYSVKEIAEKTELSESQLRTYMSARVLPLERYSKLIEAFTKLEEIELAKQLLWQLTGNDWCFYYIRENKEMETNLSKISQSLSISLGNINKIIEKLGELDRYEKGHASLDIQKMISLLFDLMRLIDREGNFLRLWK